MESRGLSVEHHSTSYMWRGNSFEPVTMNLKNGKITATVKSGSFLPIRNTKVQFNARSKTLRFFYGNEFAGSSNETLKAAAAKHQEGGGVLEELYAFVEGSESFVFRGSSLQEAEAWLDAFQDANWDYPGMVPSQRKKLPPGATD